MKCKHCNTENPSQNSFCTNCGKRLEEVQTRERSFSGADPDKTKVLQTSGSNVFNKTVILDPSSPSTSLNAGRKIIGWLVSFSQNPNGIDFKLFEGKNLISADPKSDIFLNDPAISSPHCMILIRGGKARIKDELSTNGTYLNGKDIEEAELRDGDIIKVGKTELKFRTI